ncbi:hypothetical protein A3J19_02010 [Candidatus Daviesbacteria bacterium RIFCSPLOWO2_02_FULL_41_8]|uniref:NYN domain-containing protein n=3 Tax=Candidatus Daviesiibacteriota TaxID=1752718 RepID=A0A1F5NJ04_9BACT|nr:MAG: hypothetical protein A2871_03235 [Candidatus Daviesbacteria bacterium RIFCSPHIGHO2_01_FULL_41_23]OGE32422.1 MAG: hypothetical protein A3D83_02080 [Candidatus Daviesbacteria bacterium RIFCSPHIGHO2_02_FULL_41_10]OGE61941.1 MAG: hypothetical protein A2967_03050 [Candidatus Daviesbacteria bacterium RIFCSPLOWO2_01_FULL_41_32]OGE77400.1 MAG: hypothetical protein A3J19_02010 [Candidatus Daviesbacteria bacterium RIFCSPLOWO2_02_FULL_41_8]
MKLTLEQVKHVAKKEFQLRLKGKTAVFIDWANVYGWEKSLKKEIKPEKLFKYLKSYPKIKALSFYYGKDKHSKSKQLLERAERIGFRVVSKEVKYIPVSLDSSHFKDLTELVRNSLTVNNNFKPDDIEKILSLLNKKILRRKCDFDMEIALDCFENLKLYDSFIFFSGDGDFATLYTRLIKQGKQVIVVYAPGHIGREIWELRRGLFKVSIENMGL